MNQPPKGAIFSDDGKYRYQLSRCWDTAKPSAMVIGLNPSTANADKDDPTIRILKKVLNRLGFGCFYMCNLYAYITSDPKQLITDDPEGQNDLILKATRIISDSDVYAWGAFPEAIVQGNKIRQLFPNGLCFGQTEFGTPWHPMHLMYQGLTETAELISFKENA